MGSLRLVMYVSLCGAAVLSSAMPGVLSAADPWPEPPEHDSPLPAIPPQPPTKHPVFSSVIAKLVRAAESVPEGVQIAETSLLASEPGLRAYFGAGMLDLDAAGRVQIYIRLAPTVGDVLTDLDSMGVVIERQDASGTLVQARVPVRRLAQVAELDYVAVVKAPDYGRISVGSSLTAKEMPFSASMTCGQPWGSMAPALRWA